MNLWNKFNADVEAARDLLIVTKTALKLGEKPINGEGNVADIGTNELKHGIKNKILNLQISLFVSKISVLADFKLKWTKAMQDFSNSSQKLKQIETPKNSEFIDTISEELTANYGANIEELQKMLHDAEQNVSRREKIDNQIQRLADEVDLLADKISSLDPIGREINVLQAQIAECEHLEEEVKSRLGNSKKLNAEWSQMLDKKLCNYAQIKTAQSDIEQVNNKLDCCITKIKQRMEKIDEIRKQLDNLGRYAKI